MIKLSSKGNMKYLFLLSAYHYTRVILGIIMSKIIHFSESLTLTFLMFIGEFLGGLAVQLYHKYIFYKKKGEDQSSSIKLIQGKNDISQMNKTDNDFIIFLLIFFSSFFDFNEFIILCYIPEIALISPTADQRLRILLTIGSSLLCTFALRIKKGKHHNFSLIGMSICFIIIIFELIYKSTWINFGNFILAHFLVFIRLIFVSLIDVVDKYLVEYNFFDKFKIIFLEGFFGIILSLIYAFVINKNPILEINKVYKELNVIKKILMIIFLILYFILSAGLNLYNIICNVVYTPMAKSLPAYFLNPIFIIYYLIFENDFTSKGERNYFYFSINFILSLIIDFLAFIFNEFFILNFFGLQKDTHFGISERAKTDSLLELKEIKCDEDDDFD